MQKPRAITSGLHQATSVCIIEHNVAGTAKSVDGWVLVQDSAVNGIPDSHVDTGFVNRKGPHS